MARVLITGSTDGLGLLAARRLADDGHAVTLHARNEQRAGDARSAGVPAEGVLVGDLSSIDGVRALAAQANDRGRFDAVIHNAAVGHRECKPVRTSDGLAHIFAINVLAPYLLTALLMRPDRLVYLSSGLAEDGSPELTDPQWQERDWDSLQAYSDSKLFDLMLAFGVARRWPQVRSNAVSPGWVATKMGGVSATDDLELGTRTQVWLAVSDDPGADVTGGFLFHQAAHDVPSAAYDVRAQDALFDYCAELTGAELPSA